MKHYSTELEGFTRFRLHGRFDCHIFEERIVVCNAYGPFNKELVEILARTEATAFSEYRQKWDLWAYIIEFHGDCLLTSDALPLYREFLKALKQQKLNPLVSAHIFGESSKDKLLGRELYNDVYRHVGLEVAAFSNFDDGLSWVRRQLRAL